MPLYKGSAKIKTLYHGSTKIKKLYKGSTLVYSSGYPSGTVLLEQSTAGTYTMTVLYDSTIHVDLVGAGSGGSYYMNDYYDGGSGAYISGNTAITAGTYTIVVGAGSESYHPGMSSISAGGDSTFLGNIAGGGKAHSNSSKGNGGTYTVVSTGLSGQNGGKGNTTGWINGYGAGGWYSIKDGGTPGADGYCKITVV